MTTSPGMVSLAAAICVARPGATDLSFLWVGTGVVVEGLRREGVEVELIRGSCRLESFWVDAWQAPCWMLRRFPAGRALVCALVMSDSQGADGIVASKDIPIHRQPDGQVGRGPAGRSSAVYLSVLLKEAGLHEADIEVVDPPRTLEQAQRTTLLCLSARMASHDRSLVSTDDMGTH